MSTPPGPLFCSQLLCHIQCGMPETENLVLGLCPLSTPHRVESAASHSQMTTWGHMESVQQSSCCDCLPRTAELWPDMGSLPPTSSPTPTAQQCTSWFGWASERADTGERERDIKSTVSSAEAKALAEPTVCVVAGLDFCSLPGEQWLHCAFFM